MSSVNAAGGPEWMEIMTRKRRKTLVVCGACHANIHNREPTALAA